MRACIEMGVGYCLQIVYCRPNTLSDVRLPIAKSNRVAPFANIVPDESV